MRDNGLAGGNAPAALYKLEAFIAYIITSKTRRSRSYVTDAIRHGEIEGRAGFTMAAAFEKMEQEGKLKGREAVEARRMVAEQMVADANVQKGLIPEGTMTQKEYADRDEVHLESDGTVHTNAGKVEAAHWEETAPAKPVEMKEISPIPKRLRK